jgi:GNAT superfamily N-acetyltransferase
MYEFREAIAGDIPAMKKIRDNVKENALVSITIEPWDYQQALFVDGKGWVSTFEGVVIGFSCGRLKQRDVWALFLDEQHEGRGIGNKLMEMLEGWMFSQGCAEIKLSTSPGTRAANLYRRRGWTETGPLNSGEIGFKLGRLF